jgi:uncharacterized membrane protein
LNDFEVFGCLFALTTSVWVVASIVLVVRALGRSARTERRLERLQQEVGQLRARLEAGGAVALPEAVAGPEPEAAQPPPLPHSAAPAAVPEPGEPLPAEPEPPLPPLAAPEPPPARPHRSIEEMLGARLPIWIGAVALVLGGVYLVKYSVDQGWIGPEVRVALGVGLGLALLVAGRYLRRPAAQVAAALAAAGVAVLYASFLAAVELYQLIPPPVGFALMAATTVAAVVLALAHGPIVAIVGLLGGFVTPFFMRGAAPDPRGLFAYLLLLHLALLWLARRRRWNRLGLASLFAGLGWVVFWVAGEWRDGDGPWLLVFTLAALASFLAAVLGPSEATKGRRNYAVAGAVASFMAVGAVIGQARFGDFEWAFVILLTAGLLVVARLREELHGLAWLGAVAGVCLHGAWGLGLAWEPHALPRFLVVGSVFGLVTAGGGWVAMRGSRLPAAWAALSAASAVAFTTVAWLGWRSAVEAEAADWPWVLVTLALAALSALAAWPFLGRRGEDDGPGAASPGSAVAAFAAAAAAFAALAAVQGLDGEALTVALALELPALAWLAGRFRVPVLVRLAAVLAGVVGIRLLLNPAVLDASAGEPPIWNVLLWTYGPAMVAVAAAGWLLDREAARPLPPMEGKPGRLAEVLRWGALALGLALVTCEIRHAFHPERPWGEPLNGLADPVRLLEWAAVAIAWCAVGAGLASLAERRPASLGGLATNGWRLVVSLGLMSALLGPGFAVNPLWHGDAVGPWPVANHLLWIYLAPAALAAWAAPRLTRDDDTDPKLRPAWRVGALLLAFAWVTLAARQPYRGTFLTWDSANPSAEGWTVSIAWLLLATALLVAGIATGSRLLRGASLAVFGAAVVKVFLFDVAALGDLWRVLSFLGLGASLLLLAWLYQRYVFGGKGEDEER